LQWLFFHILNVYFNILLQAISSDLLLLI
jgi:hypothetical protein